MDIFIICLVAFILILGIIGCFFPIIPGPPISYAALLIFYFFSSNNIDENTLWIWALIVIVVTLFDLWIQIYGVKKFGGTKKAVNGSIIGLIIGIVLFPPIGIIIGPFLGSFIGAKMDDQDVNKALKIALGAIAGLILGTLVKLSVSLYFIPKIIYDVTPSLW